MVHVSNMREESFSRMNNQLSEHEMIRVLAKMLGKKVLVIQLFQ